MPKALLLIADGSEEIEFVTPYDVLTRAGFEVKSVGVQLQNEGWAHCTRNIRIVPDSPTLAALPHQNAHEVYDILILPGGGPGAKTFCSSTDVLELIHRFRAAGKWVAAICAGTTALVASVKAFEDGKSTVTSHPSVKGEIEGEGWKYSEERVVVYGKVVTSRGPGTALLFALTIVEVLCGKEKRDEVAGPMIVPETL
ncbi:class I glutamine amidotransferase-like protein [Clohesyomyces aquaticus]|uniref:D-lactate dehydratase n=1 Tax=Clohesyomyces aquaticus TaxID=1231657 RepID=A0A1Y2A8N2_9PLEO|nr:class I glutamine amidotransferase-like protein [Clohesyomyces aquaticus]